MTRLGCAYTTLALHIAGNDAVFGLKVLLALALESQVGGVVERIEKLRRMAFAPLPESPNYKFRNRCRDAAAARRTLSEGRHCEMEDWAEKLDCCMLWDVD